LKNTFLDAWICEKPRKLDGSFAKAEPVKDRKYVTKEEWDLIVRLRNRNHKIKLIENGSLLIKINTYGDTKIQCLSCGWENEIVDAHGKDFKKELNENLTEHKKTKKCQLI
jgi:hypothetical protein